MDLNLRKILINKILDQIKIAIIDDNKLSHFFLEYENVQSTIRGNIYKAKINPKAKGMEASFIDIGIGRSAFLSQFNPLKEVVGDQGKDQSKITSGDFVLVQGVSDYDPRKAPKVSDFIALPSKYCVIVKKPKFFGISKKINDKKRKRFSSLKKLSTKDCGIILRTSSENETIAEIKKDISITKRKWKKIIKDFKENNQTGIIHQENNIVDNLLREFLINDENVIQTDSRAIYNRLKKDLDKKTDIKLVNKNKNIFSENNLSQEIDKIFFKKVKLKNGSFLLIEEKEGLTVIDINSGRSLNNKKETIFNINKLAAIEICRQIILRNLHGLILIDFIDLKKPKDKKEILNTMISNLKKDKAKHTILPMSKFGIIEMTRQKKGSRISTTLSEDCEICHGYGVMPRKEIKCYEIISNIINHFKKTKKKSINIKIGNRLFSLLDEIIKKNSSSPSLKSLNIKLINEEIERDFEII